MVIDNDCPVLLNGMHDPNLPFCKFMIRKFSDVGSPVVDLVFIVELRELTLVSQLFQSDWRRHHAIVLSRNHREWLLIHYLDFAYLLTLYLELVVGTLGDNVVTHRVNASICIASHFVKS